MVKLIFLVFLTYATICFVFRFFLLQKTGRVVPLGLYAEEEHQHEVSFLISGFTTESRYFSEFVDAVPGDVYFWQATNTGLDAEVASQELLKCISQHGYTKANIYAFGNGAKVARALCRIDASIAKCHGHAAIVRKTWLISPIQHHEQLRPGTRTFVRLLAIITMVLSIASGLVALLPLIPICQRWHSLAEISDQLCSIGFGSGKVPASGTIICQDDQYLQNQRTAPNSTQHLGYTFALAS